MLIDAAATSPTVLFLASGIVWLVIGDFVYFNHYPHIARGIACQKCHGEVQTMSEVRPAVYLANMALCVDSHRDNGASIDCYTCQR